MNSTRYTFVHHSYFKYKLLVVACLKVKYGLRKMNISTRMVIAICRFIVVMSVMIYSAKGRVKPYLFFNVLTSYSFSFRHTWV